MHTHTSSPHAGSKLAPKPTKFSPQCIRAAGGRPGSRAGLLGLGLPVGLGTTRTRRPDCLSLLGPRLSKQHTSTRPREVCDGPAVARPGAGEPPRGRFASSSSPTRSVAGRGWARVLQDRGRAAAEHGRPPAAGPQGGERRGGRAGGRRRKRRRSRCHHARLCAGLPWGQ